LLPIFKNRQAGPASTGLIVKVREPDEKPEEDSSSGKHACMRELANALKTDNYQAAAQALQDFFELCDSEPHEEGSHIEPHSYDSQKED
jgi:hypothetical protein